MIASGGLAFARNHGRTVMTRSRLDAPMAVVRPFDLPEGGLLVQLIALGPGLCGGDRLTIEISAEPGTRVAVTTTAATRVMSMDPGTRAEQHVILRASEDSVLEYYPCLTIPYPGSALAQTIAAESGPGARLGIVECWAMGRSARSEYLGFRTLASRTTVSSGGRTIYADAVQLDPEASDLTGAGVLAKRRYLASGVWTGVTLPGCEEPEPAIDADPLVAFGQSAPGIAYLRALGADGPAVDGAVRRSVNRVSRGWGLPAVRLDRFHS